PRPVRAQPDRGAPGTLACLLRVLQQRRLEQEYGAGRSLTRGTHVKSPREIQAILDALETQHPGADTELDYKTPFQLLVATILSAQSTDARVNIVTPALFTRSPHARAMEKARTADLEPQIHSTGFFRAKAKSLLGMATA